MKSIKERLAIKEELKRKKDAKLSGRRICFNVSVPLSNFPPLYKDSDFIYTNKKAIAAVNKIKEKTSNYFFTCMVEEFNRIEEEKTKQTKDNVFTANYTLNDIFTNPPSSARMIRDVSAALTRIEESSPPENTPVHSATPPLSSSCSHHSQINQLSMALNNANASDYFNG